MQQVSRTCHAHKACFQTSWREEKTVRVLLASKLPNILAYLVENTSVWYAPFLKKTKVLWVGRQEAQWAIVNLAGEKRWKER